jgi:autotransporter translocation and assembly factor TamB
MTGRLQGSSTWSSTGAAPNVLRSNLSASGNAVAASGQLYRFPLVDALAKTLNMKEIPTISYQDLDLRFSVDKGQVHIPQLRLSGPDLSASSTGTVSLSGDLDLDLNVVLSEEQTRRYLRGDLGKTVKQLFADPQGRVVVDFAVAGTLRAPRLQADLQSTAARSGLRALGAQEVGRLLEDVLPGKDSNLGDALRRGLGDLLGGKKGASSPDSTGKR